MGPLRALAAAALAAPLFAGSVSADWVKFGSGGWGSKWDDPVHPNPAVVTWGFMTDGTPIDPSHPLYPEVVGGSDITGLRSTVDAQWGAGAFDDALQRAFDTWHAAAGISFVGPVADGGGDVGAPGATTPDIRVGAFHPVPGSGFEFVGAVGYGPPGDDLNFPDPVAGDVMFNLSATFNLEAGAEGDPFQLFGNDLEGLFLHELGHAAIGLGHPPAGPDEVMYVGAGCCTLINRLPSPDDIEGAQSVYGPSSIPACDNGLDEDGDGFTDFPDDPGCADATGVRENPQCQDGINNDNDPRLDFDGGESIHGACSGGVCPPGVSDIDADGVADPDPQCVAKPYRNKERANSSCGLGGELLLALLPLLGVRRRSPRSASTAPSATP